MVWTVDIGEITKGCKSIGRWVHPPHVLVRGEATVADEERVLLLGRARVMGIGLFNGKKLFEFLSINRIFESLYFTYIGFKK